MTVKADVLQPFVIKATHVKIIHTYHIHCVGIAKPSEAFIALGAVEGEAHEGSGLSTQNGIVDPHNVSVVTGEITGGGHICVYKKTGNVMYCDIRVGLYGDGGKAVENKGRFPDLFSGSVQNDLVDVTGVSVRAAIKLASGNALAVTDLYVSAGRALHLYPYPTGNVFSKAI